MVVLRAGNTKVFIGSPPLSYYANCKASAGFIATVQGSKENFAEAYGSGEIAATSGRLALVLPQWADGRSDDNQMTFKSFYTDEWFKQVWFLPLSSEIEVYDPIKNQYAKVPGQMQRCVLASMLVRSQSRDGLNALLEPIQLEAFQYFCSEEGEKEFQQGLKANPELTDDQFVAMKAWEALSQKVLTFRFEKGTGVSDYKYIAWGWDTPTEDESVILLAAASIGQIYAEKCVNPQYEAAIAASANGVPNGTKELPAAVPVASLPPGPETRKGRK